MVHYMMYWGCRRRQGRWGSEYVSKYGIQKKWWGPKKCPQNRKYLQPVDDTSLNNVNAVPISLADTMRQTAHLHYIKNSQNANESEWDSEWMSEYMCAWHMLMKTTKLQTERSMSTVGASQPGPDALKPNQPKDCKESRHTHALICVSY